MLSWIRASMVHRPSMTIRRRAQKGNILEDHGRCRWRINWLQFAMYSDSLTQRVRTRVSDDAIIIVAIRPWTNSAFSESRNVFLYRSVNCSPFSVPYTHVYARNTHAHIRRRKRNIVLIDVTNGGLQLLRRDAIACDEQRTKCEFDCSAGRRKKTPNKKSSRVTWLFAKCVELSSRSAHVRIKW